MIGDFQRAWKAVAEFEKLRLSPVIDPAVWQPIKVVENQWLAQQRLREVPRFQGFRQPLVPKVPVAPPAPWDNEWATAFAEVSTSLSPLFERVGEMSEKVASAMAQPFAGMARLGEQLARPVQGWKQLANSMPAVWNFEGFWQNLQPVLEVRSSA